MIPYIYLFLMSILDIIMESSDKNKFIILAMLIYSLQPIKSKKYVYFLLFIA